MAKDLQFTFKRPCLEISGEIGSLAELIGYMQEESATLTLAFGDDMELVVQRIGGATGEPSKEVAVEKPKRTYTRKAAPEAVAPEPLPVPSAAPSPVPSPSVTGVAGETAPPLAPTPLPPNELAPPPPPPSLPPVGVLGPKMVKVMDDKAAGAQDGGQGWSDWLASHGLTQKGATYSDACRAILMMRDDKLTAAAAQLGVS